MPQLSSGESILAKIENNCVFLIGHSLPRFLYFRLFNTVDSKQNLPVIGIELQNSGVGSNSSTNGVATTALKNKHSSLGKYLVGLTS